MPSCVVDEIALMRRSTFVAIQAKGNSVATPFGLRSGLRQSGIPLIACRDEWATRRRRSLRSRRKTIQSLRPSGFALALAAERYPAHRVPR
jgi:hypothetical protein